MSKKQLPPPEQTEQPPHDFNMDPPKGPEDVKIGEWFWVHDKVKWDGDWTNDNGKPMKKGEPVEWLGCVMQVGSNFIEVHSPHSRDGHTSLRVHFDEFEKMLKPAPNADEYIAGQQVFYQQRVNVLLEEVREVTAKLGIVPTQMIAEQHNGEGQNGLVVVTAQPDTKKYKNALIKAKDKTLPKLFEDIKKANKQLARWMIAPSMPLTASIGPMEESIHAIKDRIYTIELYAGLTEEAVKCCDGAPAGMLEKLHVMQRRLYMDEECLAAYEAGGMEYQDIGQFDAWISKPENRNRLLPFERTLVAFRVRRQNKEREHEGNIWRMHVNFQLEAADKKTFLYVRNGEQVWRIDCDFEFDEMIVPNKEDFNPSEPMMVKMFGDRVEKMIPRKRWESLYAEQVEQQKKYDEWAAANPDPSGGNWIRNPFHNSLGFRNEYQDYKPFDATNVYYDDALKEIGDKIKRYNRIAVIVQGLFDRSEVLHPHPQVKMWVPESFEKAVELTYDAVTLTHGDPPDFEEFRRELNASLGADSIVTGQEDFWLRREAQRENARITNDWRHRGTHPDYTRFHPDSDPGPGLVGPMTDWKARAHKAVFKWTRESRSYSWPRTKDAIPASVEVPESALFNVSAYKPGDFKRFFADPRTRRDYLKWAPMMLVAEDYHAGKRNGKRKK